jgi:protein gp37
MNAANLPAARDGWEYEDYVRAWRELESRSAWWKGDLALAVETSYGEHTLERYATDVGTDYGALKTLRAVSRAWPEKVRRLNISWSVHQALAAQADRAELVASRDDWKLAEARELVRARADPTITLYTHTGEPVAYPAPRGQATFNETTGDGISWAAWSWNPVTGCLHGCPYCYARAIANRWRDQFPAGPDGFMPLFHSERLDAPRNTAVPSAHRGDKAWRRVFVCSMADLYGRWVPGEWIDKVHAAMLASPQWQYILLTKFPERYPHLQLPPGAWVGTSVDEQKRVRIAERAFRQLPDGVVTWLSLEPLREPLRFTDLSAFDWVVIGAQTETRQPGGTEPAMRPEWDWVVQIYTAARKAGCRVHLKPNLLSVGMALPDEYPADSDMEE